MDRAVEKGHKKIVEALEIHMMKVSIGIHAHIVCRLFDAEVLNICTYMHTCIHAKSSCFKVIKTCRILLNEIAKTYEHIRTYTVGHTCQYDTA